MSYFILEKNDIWFPNPEMADGQGVVALGGDLRPERLLLAYRHGIFPWFNYNEPIIWWCPDPRFVLFPDQLKIRRSLKKVIRSNRFEIRYDTAFEEVITKCATVERLDQDGTWITANMFHAYNRLHQLGHAHSVETWLDGELVGGLYGIAMGPFFFGESMFHLVSDASKVALVALVERFQHAPYIDCQVHNEFFESMGASHISRAVFLETLQSHIDEPSNWEQTLVT